MQTDIRVLLERTALIEPLHNLGRSVSSLYIVGGFLRDVLRARLDGGMIIPKDIDVVVDTDILEPLLRRMSGTLARTALGGFRWTPPGARIPVDLWQLRDTIWIRERNLFPDIDGFLAGVDLNVDRVAFDLHGDRLIADECLAALRSRRIDLDAPIAVPALAHDEAARACMIARKTGYAITPSLRDRLSSLDRRSFLRNACRRLLADGYDARDVRSACEAAFA